MRRGIFHIAALLTLALISGCAHNGRTGDPRAMAFPSLEFQIPKAERVVLENGLTVYLMEDRELPLITVTGYIGTGSAYEPAEKTGLAGITGNVLRTGGAEGLPPEKIDDELEFTASAVECAIATDAGTCTMSSLKKNFDRTLDIYSQLLMKPAFRDDRFEVARKQTLEYLRRQNDDPKQLADRELTKAIYQGSPLGRVPTVATVNAINRQDLLDFHSRYFRPNNTILAIAGDFERNEMLAKLTKAFSGWQKRDVSLPQVDPPLPIRQEILLVEKGVNQSVIRMGHLGIEKSNPDLYAIRVMDAILGSNGFNSRLMAEIRTNQGLAYNVGSHFDIGRRFVGTFEAETETKAGSTTKTIGLMKEIIDGMRREPVSDQELKLAKDSIINSFIFGFTSTAAVVSQLARLEYYGYPPGYLENYRQRIAAVTKEDVQRVAKQYLHPEKLVVVVVGSREKFDQPLGTFGEVREIKPDSGTR
ncbi:pitrilysin family protein [Geobacter sp. DSM 9736]|uniref:M16 family metallopeptidase n=1 Tax=Geobacter sp. DSM 9736 TaxID=1277350 RepID=UPI000B4FE658|nr:pitrilysin family protein [Geobacter sp. DSM 9736]SNB48094.1 Predicted Zn-dependent peptidase [Geobacter sp. DSM 9736]